MSNNPAKYEVLIKQYLRSILDISGPNGLASCRKLNLPGDQCRVSFLASTHKSQKKKHFTGDILYFTG